MKIEFKPCEPKDLKVGDFIAVFPNAMKNGRAITETIDTLSWEEEGEYRETLRPYILTTSLIEYELSENTFHRATPVIDEEDLDKAINDIDSVVATTVDFDYFKISVKEIINKLLGA